MKAIFAIKYDMCGSHIKLAILRIIQEVCMITDRNIIKISTCNLNESIKLELELYNEQDYEFLKEAEEMLAEVSKTKYATIDKVITKENQAPSVEFIQKNVCEYFNVPVEMMQSSTRKREVVQARQVSMYFSKALTKASLANIGSQIGDKDHATVLHACKTINNLLETDKRFRAQMAEIERRLKG